MLMISMSNEYFLLQTTLRKESDNVVWNAVYDAVTESTPPPRATSSFQQTPLSINTGIPGFFDASFGDVPGLRPAAQAVFDKCKEGEKGISRNLEFDGDY
jgi:hypothetical protein